MESKRTVYLDNSATTRISDVALAKYNEVSLSNYGNPSSLHTLGFNAEKELKAARQAICASLGARDAEIIFTASGSEANNLAIIGRAEAKDRFLNNATIISTMGEHASVSEPLKKLESRGFKVSYLKTEGGALDLDELASLCKKDTVLVTMMMVNNETGALYDIKRASDIIKAKSPDALIHVDATQSYMKIPFTMKSIGADMVTVSSHKIAGPKGVGALVILPGVKKSRGLSPLILGGGQEGGLRSGTENVPAIAAFGVAAQLGTKNLTSNNIYLESLRKKLIEKITNDKALSEISITNPQSHAPHILNITLPSIKSETMLHFLSAEGIFVSSGSACSSNTGHKSSALLAYGKSENEADSSIRISFSPLNTEEDLEVLCDALKRGLSRLVRMR